MNLRKSSNKFNARHFYCRPNYNSGGMMLDEDACQIASQIQNCLHIKLENAGHLLHTNETDRLLYHVLNFLGSL